MEESERKKKKKRKHNKRKRNKRKHSKSQRSSDIHSAALEKKKSPDQRIIIEDDEMRRMIRKKIGLYHVNPEHMEQLQDQGIKVRLGKWKKTEDQYLLNTIIKYCKKHGVHDVQSLFTTDDDNDAWSRYNINKIRFRKKICKGIPRPPAYIYERAKRILDINNHKGCFTAEEIELLKKLQRRHGNKWALIGAKMKRHRQALRDKFKEFKENRVTGPWTREERSALKNAVKEIAGTDDLHSVTKIPWLEVSKKVSTRTANQCRREWAHFLCWSESDRRSHVWKESDNAVLIERIYQTPDLYDESDIDWQDLLQYFPDVPTVAQLKIKWYLLKTKHVADHQMKTLDDIARELHQAIGHGISSVKEYKSKEFIDDDDDSSDCKDEI